MLQQATIIFNLPGPRWPRESHGVSATCSSDYTGKPGPDHVNVATSYNKLASIYKDLGDLKQAKEYQQRALVIRLDKLGPEHVNIATSYNNLSLIYQDLGDLEKAKEYQERALAINLDKLGAEHFHVVTS